jgi:hypothetical protein
MRTIVVVVEPPSLNNLPGIRHAQEVVGVEAFVSKSPVEAFDVRLVGRFAWAGEVAVPALLEILASPEHPENTKGHAAWALAFIGSEASEHLYSIRP